MRLILVVFLFLSSGAAADLRQLSFLSGCWAGGGVEEVWLKPDGGTMLGMSRTVKGGKTVSAEFLHIASAADGSIVLNAQPKLAGKATPFTLVDIRSGTATFSNPQHDFPQRIIYRSEPDGSLFARIEGNVNGKERHQDFKYARAKCGS